MGRAMQASPPPNLPHAVGEEKTALRAICVSPPNLPHVVGEEKTALRAICVSPPNLPYVVGEACLLPLHLWGGPGWGSNVGLPNPCDAVTTLNKPRRGRAPIH